jgi:O-acetylhomoserine (thiol)-lyase
VADPTTHARAFPLYQTTSYTFRHTNHAANLPAFKELGNMYTRIMNPTQAAVVERLAALAREGWVLSAITATQITALAPGAHDLQIIRSLHGHDGFLLEMR